MPPARLAEAIDDDASTSSPSAPCSCRPARSPTLDAILAAAAAHDVLTRRRRHAGRRLAAARRDALRLPVARRLQVADRRRAARRGMAVAPERLDAIVPAGAAGSPASDSTTRTTGRRCGSPPTRAGSTPPPPGSPGSAPRRRSSCWRRSAIEAIHEHDVGLANRFRAGLDWSRATPRSSPSTGDLRTASRGHARGASPLARCGWAFTSTTTKRTPTGWLTSSKSGKVSSQALALEAPPSGSAVGANALRRNPYQVPRRARPPARGGASAASRASSAGTSCARPGASSRRAGGSPGRSSRR